MATRWGIISAGGISSKFVSALVKQNPNEHKVVAIAARSKEKAQAFADKFSIQTAYGSYEEFVQNPDVEVVYIGSIHPEHHKLSVLCLNAGKHVLCEKPVTMTVAAAKELFALAKEKKLFFMEGFWTRTFPVFDQVRRELESGTLGDIKMVTAKFCVNNYSNERIHKKELGGGGLLDLGCYTVMFADFVFNEKPEKISVEGQLSESGVDIGAAITLRFSGGRIASLVYNTTTKHGDNAATILGSEGSIRIEPPFWAPTKLSSPMGTFDFKENLGFQYEQRCVRECLQKGLLECPLITHENSLNIMGVIETVLNELGVKYDFPYTV
ncbi:trans-1,2-dihydrobenzene-1,2-diol dehydrogenase-like isoform X2 [Haliotis rufescens]|nr:trans-1,2-dihydrobenzene-1,2-diol dehydrogenase-like isoform X2 [Haliotis rufescens]XP_048242209.1 trans-1,2-dihydrobenzene-1,2-diol dehydrogenase-like isoform X2 [Haliotis rufescens]